MNWPYLHLLTNHLPIILGALGAGAMGLAILLRRRGVWLYATATMTLAGASAYPVVLVGGAAQEFVQEVPGVRRRALDDHEEASERAMFVLLVAGALSAACWRRLVRPAGPPSGVGRATLAASEGAALGAAAAPPLPVWLRAATAVSSFAAAGLVTYAAYLGGHVIHGDNSVVSPPSVVAPELAPGATPDGAIDRATDEGGRRRRGRDSR